MSYNQILSMAEQLEVIGERNYRQFAECAVGEAQRLLFTALADDEVEHLQTFRRMREDLSTGAAPDVELRPEQFLELHDILVGQQRHEPTQALAEAARASSGAQLLHKAIDFERAAVVMFTRIGRYATDPRGARTIQAVIAEELKHIESLRGHLPAQ